MLGLQKKSDNNRMNRRNSDDRRSFCCPVSNLGKIVLIATIFSFSAMTAEAQLLDWISSRGGKSRRPAAVASEKQSEGLSVIQTNQHQDAAISGNNLDSYKFAQSHWTHSKNKLQKACRAISSKYNDAATRDILQKLFVVNTQLFRENIKNSALAVKEIKAANENIRHGLTSLSRIVTAPGQETLEALEKVADQVFAANVSQSLLVKKYLTGSELIILMGQSAYETLELIPSLSQPGLDLFVDMSKQLMRMTQSNGEAFKGLLLNAQTSTEVVANGIQGIKRTVRETLRFSDHFAIKQFPLINLPTPTREKIFNQLNALANSVKGVENTIAIGDSQVRNNSQQFTHLTSGFVDKAEESLRYQNNQNADRPLEQISAYARNQVSGLFLRIKEDVGQMRAEMAKAARPINGNTPPSVKFESQNEYASRRTMSVADDKLPLFLLGSKGRPGQISPKQSEGLIVPQEMAKTEVRKTVVDTMEGFEPLKDNNTQVLYSEKFGSSDEYDLAQSEVNLLSQELGSDFFFGKTGDNLSKSSLMARGGPDMPDFGEDDEEHFNISGSTSGYDESDSMHLSYGNLAESAEPEMELLRFDSLSAADSGELMPLMRLDSGALSFDE